MVGRDTLCEDRALIVVLDPPAWFAILGSIRLSWAAHAHRARDCYEQGACCAEEESESLPILRMSSPAGAPSPIAFPGEAELLIRSYAFFASGPSTYSMLASRGLLAVFYPPLVERLKSWGKTSMAKLASLQSS
jgi:hypothetical protein